MLLELKKLKSKNHIDLTTKDDEIKRNDIIETVNEIHKTFKSKKFNGYLEILIRTIKGHQKCLQKIDIMNETPDFILSDDTYECLNIVVCKQQMKHYYVSEKTINDLFT